MADFFNVTSNVSQFGPDDCDINRYKQAGEYALESKYWACQSKKYHDDTVTEVTNILENAGDQATLLVLGMDDGLKRIGRCPDISTLRTIEPTINRQKIEVIQYADGYKPITGYFEFDPNDHTSNDDGGVCIVTSNGNRWKRVFDGPVNLSWFGIPNNGDITSAISRALSYTNSKSLGLSITAGQYIYNGSSTLEIDLGLSSLVCPVGRASIDFSNSTATYAIHVFSSAEYPDALYHNTTNMMSGIEIFGSRVAGKHGLLIGSPTTTIGYNGQSIISNCSFHDFDQVITCTHNTWRYKFDKCSVSKGISYVFYAPSGLINSGESITFVDSQISDSSGAPFNVSCDSFSLGFISTSVLNTRIQISGISSTVSMSGMSNIENPGLSSWYPYVTVTGRSSRFILSESTLTINQPSVQTQPVFFVGPESFIIFNSIKFPGNGYKFEVNSTDGVRAFVEGSGSVMCNNCSSDNSGAGNIPIHRSFSPIHNSGFESGNVNSWRINTSGSVSQTATVSSSSAKTGSYGLRLKSISGLSIFATQKFNVKPGQYYSASFWAKVVTAGLNGNASGNITLSFYTENDTQITGPTATLPVAVTDWAVYGNFIKGTVPAGAVTAILSIRSYDGAVIDFDGVLLNLM